MATKKSSETMSEVAAALSATEETIPSLAENEAYGYDKDTCEYKGIVTRQKNPREGGYLMPAHSTLVSPEGVTAGEHEAVIFDAESGAWTTTPDYRGTTWYDIETQERHEIKELGIVPEDDWTDKAPGDYQTVWNAETGEWEIDAETQEMLDQQVAQARAKQIIQDKLILQAAQTLDFTAEEFATMALAGNIFPEWEAGATYSAGERVAYTAGATATLSADSTSDATASAGTIIYQVVSDVTASEDNPPSADSETYTAISVTAEAEE